MVKSLFWAAVGAGAILQADRWLQKRKAQFSPNALTGRLLDTVNNRLEQSRTRSTAAPGRGGA